MAKGDNGGNNGGFRTSCQLLGKGCDSLTSDPNAVALALFNKVAKDEQMCTCCSHGFMDGNKKGCRSGPVVQVMKILIRVKKEDPQSVKDRKRRVESVLADPQESKYLSNIVNPPLRGKAADSKPASGKPRKSSRPRGRRPPDAGAAM